MKYEEFIAWLQEQRSIAEQIAAIAVMELQSIDGMLQAALALEAIPESFADMRESLEEFATLLDTFSTNVRETSPDLHG